MGTGWSCLSSAQVHAPVAVNTWKQLLDADDALKKYVKEQTLSESATDGELELRALLDDGIGFKTLMDLGDINAKSVLTCWKDLGSDKLCKDIVCNSVQIISKVCKIFDGKENDMHTLLNSLTDKDEEEVFRLSVIVRKASFGYLYHQLFLPFKESTDYIVMCQKIRQSYNTVNVDDFDYYSSLGQGAFGVVLHCVKRSTKKSYAMKIQVKSHLFKHHRKNPALATIEMLALAGISHPYMAELSYAFQTGKLVIMTIPASVCGDLGYCLINSPKGYFSFQRVQFYIAEVVSALIYLHGHDLIYRDLKPQNIVLHADGHIMLCDLGSIADKSGALEDRFSRSRVNSLSNFNEDEDHTVTHKFGASPRSPMFAFVAPLVDCPSKSDRMLMGLNSAASSGRYNARASSLDETTDTDAQTNTEEVGEKNSSYNAPKSRCRSIVGTLSSMAPEIIHLFAYASSDNVESSYTNAVDWWSVGILIFSLSVGRAPYTVNIDYKKLHNIFPKIFKHCNENIADAFQYVFGKLDISKRAQDLLTPAGYDIVTAFLEMDVEKRLGMNKKSSVGRDKYSDLKSHAYFEGIDWNLLNQKKVTPPYIPMERDQRNIVDECMDKFPFSEMLEILNKGDWLDDIKPPPGQSSPPSTPHHREIGRPKSFADIPPEQDKFFENWYYVSPAVIALEVERAHSIDL